MQEEEKKPEALEDDLMDETDDSELDDLDLGEDIDIEDFDEDDFEDASWDDFDDDADKTTQQQSDTERPQGAAVSAGVVKQKSFISKNFNAIVIAVAVIGVGGWFLMKMSAPGPATQDTQPPQDTAQIDDPAIQETALPDLEQAQETPSGGFLDNPELLAGQIDKSLEQREEALSTIEEAPPMPTPMHSATEEAAAPRQIDVLTPMPEKIAQLEEQQQPAYLSEPSNKQPGEIIAVEEAPPMPDQPVQEPVIEEMAADPEPDKELEPQAAPEIVGIEEQSSEIVETNMASLQVKTVNSDQLEEIYDRIKDLEDEIEGSNDRLAQQIANTNNKINTLTNMIVKLEESMADLTISSAQQATRPPKTPIATPKPKAIPKDPPKPKAKIDTQPIVKQKKVERSSKNTGPVWELRSAGPGKALIAEKGSSDFKSVKVGDSLAGIGRITSIGVENGKWVVKGTKGRISQ